MYVWQLIWGTRPRRFWWMCCKVYSLGVLVCGLCLLLKVCPITELADCAIFSAIYFPHSDQKRN